MVQKLEAEIFMLGPLFLLLHENVTTNQLRNGVIVRIKEIVKLEEQKRLFYCSV